MKNEESMKVETTTIKNNSVKEERINKLFKEIYKNEDINKEELERRVNLKELESIVNKYKDNNDMSLFIEESIKKYNYNIEDMFFKIYYMQELDEVYIVEYRIEKNIKLLLINFNGYKLGYFGYNGFIVALIDNDDNIKAKYSYLKGVRA